MPSVRSWFMRDVLALVERERGADAVTRVLERMPTRVRESCHPSALRSSGAQDLVALADAEELLLGLESVLGDGSGRLLEHLGMDLATRTLSQTGTSVIIGDLYGTVARLRVPFEHPFVKVQVRFEVSRTPAGFSVDVSSTGNPRLSRVLRHLAGGAILAAQRFAGERTASLRLHGETRGDRARIDVVLSPTTSTPPPSEGTPSRRGTRPATRPVTQPSLSAQVNEIFARSPSLAPERDPRRPSSGSSTRPPTNPSPFTSNRRTDPLGPRLTPVPPEPSRRPATNPGPFAPNRRSDPRVDPDEDEESGS